MSSEQPVNEEVDYRPLPMQTEFIGRNVVEIKPVSNDYNINTIQFRVPNNTPNHLIDCSKIELVTKANILKSDGTTKLAHTVTNVGVVNNVLHSMWSNVNVELNNKTVTPNDGLYPYKAYLEKLTTFTPEHTKTFGVRSGFVMDEASNMDGNVVKRQADAVTESVKDDPGGRAVTVIKTLAVEENYMAKRMAGYFHGNANTPGATTYSDGLSTVPFNTKFLLPHKIEMKINLQRHDHTFYMMDGTAHGYRIVIEDITLRVPYAIVTDEIFMKIERGISAHGAKMPVSRIGIIEDTIAKGTTIATIQGLIKGNMPDQVYIAMVENGVTKGDKAKNPFNFQHFNLKEYEIRAAGRTFPNNRMPLDFDNGQYLPAWLDLMRTMDMESDGFGSLIDYEDYPDGFTIIGVDLTAALPSDVDVKPAPLEGELSVKLWFENELAQAVSILVFGVYSDEIIIDQNRFVRVSWE